ncbi:MAG: type transport system permease protein [Gaiellales bacterium]|jgi:ABC-2 type transport system permease protein|nr:type transport system permease protein [Gaiellales bacterium]
MTLRAYRWELRKLAAQKRTLLGLGAVFVVPLIFVTALVLRPPTAEANDPFFFRYVTESGFAVPLVLLLFSAIWFFPLVTALVAGDIVAAEDQNRTLKTILTRSTSRSALFAAKVLAAFTYAAAALVVMGLTATVAGGLASGFDPLTTFTDVISAQRAAVLVAGSFAVYAMPVLAIASIGVLLSTTAKNSAGAVVGTLLISLVMQLTRIIPGLDGDGVQDWLLTRQLNAWQGLFREPIDWSPIWHAAWVSALYAGVALVAAWLHFVRRDVQA